MNRFSYNIFIITRKIFILVDVQLFEKQWTIVSIMPFVVFFLILVGQNLFVSHVDAGVKSIE